MPVMTCPILSQTTPDPASRVEVAGTMQYEIAGEPQEVMTLYA